MNGTKGIVKDFFTEDEAYDFGVECASGTGPRPDVKPPRTIELGKPPPGMSRRFDGRWPLVVFETGKKLLCNQCVFDVKSTEGVVEAMREQVTGADGDACW